MPFSVPAEYDSNDFTLSYLLTVTLERLLTALNVKSSLPSKVRMTVLYWKVCSVSCITLARRNVCQRKSCERYSLKLESPVQFLPSAWSDCCKQSDKANKYRYAVCSCPLLAPNIKSTIQRISPPHTTWTNEGDHAAPKHLTIEYNPLSYTFIAHVKVLVFVIVTSSVLLSGPLSFIPSISCIIV